MSEEIPYEERLEEIRKHEQPKTHHECKCRECDPLTAMTERVEAFASATSLLRRLPRPDDDGITVSEALAVADWLLYGPGSGE